MSHYCKRYQTGLTSMLRIAQKLYVGALSDLCEMYKLFIKTMWPKVSVSLTNKAFLFKKEKSRASKSIRKIYPLKIELKTSLSVSSKKDNSRRMTSSATSLLVSTFLHLLLFCLFFTSSLRKKKRFSKCKPL